MDTLNNPKKPLFYCFARKIEVSSYGLSNVTSVTLNYGTNIDIFFGKKIIFIL